jgi:integrase-like protein
LCRLERAGTHVSLDSDLTIADVAEKWIRKVEADARERATVRQYRQYIKHHIVPRIGAVKMAKLTKGHVEGFRDRLLAGDPSRLIAREHLELDQCCAGEKRRVADRT